MGGVAVLVVVGDDCWPRYSTVFFLTGRFGQLNLSWLQPFTQPPERRMGMSVRAECEWVLLGGVDVDVVPPAAAALRFSSDQVRSSFWSMYLRLASLCFMTMNSQWLTLRRSSKYSTDQWYLGRVSACAVLAARKSRRVLADSPLHEEDARHEAVGDEDADARKVVVAKLA